MLYLGYRSVVVISDEARRLVRVTPNSAQSQCDCELAAFNICLRLCFLFSVSRYLEWAAYCWIRYCVWCSSCISGYYRSIYNICASSVSCSQYPLFLIAIGAATRRIICVLRLYVHIAYRPVKYSEYLWNRALSTRYLYSLYISLSISISSVMFVLLVLWFCGW